MIPTPIPSLFPKDQSKFPSPFVVVSYESQSEGWNFGIFTFDESGNHHARYGRTAELDCVASLAELHNAHLVIGDICRATERAQVLEFTSKHNLKKASKFIVGRAFTGFNQFLVHSIPAHEYSTSWKHADVTCITYRYDCENDDLVAQAIAGRKYAWRKHVAAQVYDSGLIASLIADSCAKCAEYEYRTNMEGLSAFAKSAVAETERRLAAKRAERVKLVQEHNALTDVVASFRGKEVVARMAADAAMRALNGAKDNTTEAILDAAHAKEALRRFDAANPGLV